MILPRATSMAESASISRSIVSTSAVVTNPTAIVSIESAIASTRRESAEERNPAVRFKCEDRHGQQCQQHQHLVRLGVGAGPPDLHRVEQRHTEQQPARHCSHDIDPLGSPHARRSCAHGDIVPDSNERTARVSGPIASGGAGTPGSGTVGSGCIGGAGVGCGSVGSGIVGSGMMGVGGTGSIGTIGFVALGSVGAGGFMACLRQVPGRGTRTPNVRTRDRRSVSGEHSPS